MQKNVVSDKRNGFCGEWENTPQRFLKILSKVFSQTSGGFA